MPGCKGGENVKFATDYCVNPVDVDGVEPVLTARTHETVDSAVYSQFCGRGANTCLLCMGNCNRNEDVSVLILLKKFALAFHFHVRQARHTHPLSSFLIHSVLTI